MEEQFFKQATDRLSSGGIYELRNFLNPSQITILEYANYAMAFPFWTENRFNATHFKQLTNQEFSSSNHFIWKLEKGLLSFDELVSKWSDGEPYSSHISSFFLNNIQRYNESQKKILTEKGIFNENTIFKNDLEKGIIPFNTFHQYQSNAPKNSLIQEFIRKQMVHKLTQFEELKYYYDYKVISDREIELYCTENGIQSPIPKQQTEIEIPSSLWTNPIVMENRTDLVLIGNSLAGKTMILASFLKCCESKGNLNFNTSNSNGTLYGNILTNAISKGRLITVTPPENFLTIALDFRINVSIQLLLRTRQMMVNAPVNLIELPGEAFKNSFSALNEDGIPVNIREAVYNNNKNPKVYIFTIPVDEQEILIATSSGPVNVNSQGFYCYFLDYLQRIGKMNNVVAIALIFTKWDKYKSGTKDDFVNQNCLNLKNALQAIVNRNHNIKAAYFTHSLGIFNEQTRSYTYNSSDMNEIYDWLMDVLPYQN